MKLLVMKFGGSSVRDSVAMERVTSIIAGKLESAQLVVVVSAMGDTTDHLQAVLDAVEAGQESTARSVAEKIKSSHFETVAALPLDDGRKADCHKAVKERIERLNKLIDGTDFAAIAVALAKPACLRVAPPFGGVCERNRDDVEGF